MAKTQTKDRQYNGQNKNEGQTMQWPKQIRRTDNTMAKTKTKDRQYNGQNKKEKQKPENEGQIIQWPKQKGKIFKRHEHYVIWKSLNVQI
jgi:hypothetical protein